MQKQLLIFICLFLSFEVKSEQIFISCEMKFEKFIGSDGHDFKKEYDRVYEKTITMEFFVDSKKKIFVRPNLIDYFDPEALFRFEFSPHKIYKEKHTYQRILGKLNKSNILQVEIFDLNRITGEITIEKKSGNPSGKFYDLIHGTCEKIKRKI